jgi:acetyl esterase/lipase
MVADPRAVWGALTAAERHAAYDNMAASVNGPELAAARNAASAAFRARHAGKLDLAYGAAEREKWDIYPPKNPRAPVLVFIHGGYWQMNARENFAVVAEGALSWGLGVAMPGHTLAPQASLTEIVAQIRSALDWLAREGAAHGVGGPAIVSGWSAGGHLAAMALDHPHMRAGVGISGVYELGPIRDTKYNVAMKFTDVEVATLSPLRLPVVNKPFALAYGSREVPALVEDARKFHALRADAHAAGALIPIAGANHFSVLDALRDPKGEILAEVVAMAGRLG